jgi:hypothetical protein
MAQGVRVKAEWLCREKEEGLSTKESLMRMVGRRGLKLKP